MTAPDSPIAPRVIAVFDYDGTLVENDSFGQFLSLLSSAPVFYLRLIEGIVRFSHAKWKKLPSNLPDPSLRTFVKHHLIKTILAGRHHDELRGHVGNLHKLRRWKRPIHDKLLDHHVRGHHIVIATGSLDLYIYNLLAHVPHHAVICTEMGVVDGVVTDKMTSGNCTHDRKAERVRAYIEEHGPFDDSYGYGNTPHDLAMLSLLNHKVIV
ncbi:MAG: HAD-IB family phosphatase [Alphaproteobacteria bacterium]|nr:HAD-IB family phosphatase [Alphaproteobacteria bacterium]